MNVTGIIDTVKLSLDIGEPTFYVGVGVGAIAILIVFVMSFLFNKIFPLNKVKGGDKKMGRPKGIKNKSTEDNDFESESGFIQELDDHPEDTEEVEEEIVDSTSDKWKIVESKIDVLENAITTNQKYIKKIWERVKDLEDNFKILIEKKWVW